MNVPRNGGLKRLASRTLLLGLVILLCFGCTSTRYQTLTYAPHLLDGQAAFDMTIKPAAVVDPLWVSDAMREFIDKSTLDRKSNYARFRWLMNKLVENEFFIDQYDASATFTAARTFAVRKGNCVAYTNLFVAMAREAGLDAQFQLVTGHPVWNVESGYLIKNNHINVLVKNITVPGFQGNEMTVDFNMVNIAEDARRQQISDAYASSLFYANIAIDHLHRRGYATSFAYLKRAIITAPTNHDLWNNLGVLYSVLQLPQLAQQAYETALRLDAANKTAIAGVAKSLEQQGRLEEAADYAALALRYQRRNPYYHFAVAQQAFSRNAYAEALAAINEAIEIKKRSNFYALRAATAKQLGDEILAEESYRLQHKYRNRRDRVHSPLSRHF